MKGGRLSHQWRLFQISRLTLFRSKSRIINFTNSVLPYNEWQIIYLSLTTLSDITGCFLFILQSSYFQALPNLELNVTAPGANLKKFLLTVPSLWQNQNRCPPSLLLPTRGSFGAKYTPKTNQTKCMKIVTDFNITCDQNCHKF